MRRALLAVGLTAFVVMLVVSLRALDVGATELRWGPLLVAGLLLTPLTIAGNAAELRVMAAGTAPERLSWLESIRVVVLATAANFLPIPGAALVRVQALRTRGATGAAAAGINLAGAGAWLGSGLLVAGLTLVPTRGLVAVLAAVAGLAACIAAGLLVARVALPDRAWRTTARLLVVELLVTVLSGVRLLVVISALQVDLGLLQALVIALSAPLSAAAGVFPSGIGLAEAISGLLAPAVALPVAVGVAATGLNRVVGLVVTIPLAGWLTVRAPAEAVPAGGPTAADPEAGEPTAGDHDGAGDGVARDR